MILVLVMVVSGLIYSVLTRRSGGPESAGLGVQTNGEKWSFDLSPTPFAESDETENVSAIPSVPSVKFGVGQIENLESLSADGGIALTDGQKSALEESGFFLAENDLIGDAPQSDDFTDMYGLFGGPSNPFYRQPDDAVFVTSDVALHLFHVLVDRSFQEIEETKFQPMLRQMTEALFLDSVDGYRSAGDEKMKDSYGRLAAFYLIPLAVLDAGSRVTGPEPNPEDFGSFAQYLEAVDRRQEETVGRDLDFALTGNTYAGQELDGRIVDMARAELELIRKAEGKAPSPIFTPLRPEFENDYSQFRPRSHYTKNDTLKSYFIAMMWFGRMGFPLSSPDLTRDALVITGQVNNLTVGERKLSSIWSDMAAVIDFFVGETDDLTAFHYSGLAREVYGNGFSPDGLANDARLADFIGRARRDLPAPKIISEVLWVDDDGGKRDDLLADLKQFRFMGQRFTPDAHVINRLTQGIGRPDPETGQMLPTMPTALMPMRVLAPANPTVREYLGQWVADPVRIAGQGRESDRVIAKVLGELDAEFSGYGPETWTRNVYWRWLDAFRVLLRGYGDGYPDFMRSAAWSKKNLGTALGSLTELKHDTLLYAKQSYAELGAGPAEGGEMPPVAKGYVEPDLDFWNRIVSLAEVTRKGLLDREVFPESYSYKYDLFVDSARFFRQLAKQELGNETIGDDDFERLRTVSSVLNRIVEPIGGQELTEREKRAGIVADIHTDAVRGQVLYQATGKPLIAYVAVSDANGTRLTRGAVFSHYEFAGEMGKRLTDEDWQAVVYGGEGEMPAIDPWTADLTR